MPPYPHVRSLRVRNFKGIAKLDLSLDQSLTLLAGVNGVGKTSVIEALLAGVTGVWHWLVLKRGQAFFTPTGDLLRYGSNEGNVTLEMMFEDNVTVPYDATVLANSVALSMGIAKAIAIDKRAESTLPLVLYYDQNRIGGLVRSEQGPDTSRSNRDAALDTTPHALQDFKSWFFEKEGDQAREAIDRNDLDYADPEVRAVQEVLKGIAGRSAVLRSRKPDGSMERILYLRREGDPDIPFEALSGGEKAYFLLAVDLARRLLLEFPGSTIAEAPGLVCIDEIELHLHPAWQRNILKSLMDQFRRCQFVVSTHSPQVIGSVAARHVRLLTSDGKGRIDATRPIASRGRDSNYVLEGILDTPRQDPGVDDLFAEVDRLLDAGALAKADRVLDKLDDLIEGKSSRVAVRRAKRRRLDQTAK